MPRSRSRYSPKPIASERIERRAAAARPRARRGVEPGADARAGPASSWRARARAAARSSRSATPASASRVDGDLLRRPARACRAPGTPPAPAPRDSRRRVEAAPSAAGGRRAATRTSSGPRPNARIASIASAMISASARWPGLADEVAVELEVLAQPPPLLPLVAKELRDGEPADRLPEPVRARRHHARERRRHLRPQRDLAARPCR